MKKQIIYMLIFVMAVGVGSTYGAYDVTGPNDPVLGVPETVNDGAQWWEGEEPFRALDNDAGTKFLHFRHHGGDVELIISPQLDTNSSQPTRVQGLTFTTGGDAPERDPVAYELYGSNESTEGSWTLISAGPIEDFNDGEWPRMTQNERWIAFNNDNDYLHYRLIFTDFVEDGLFQIAEVELLKFVDNALFYITNQPQDTKADMGSTATIDTSVFLENGDDSDIDYQWYKSEDDQIDTANDVMLTGSDPDISGVNSSELVIENTDSEDDGYYYCEITNTLTSVTIYTKVVFLSVNRLLGYWTLDQADYDGYYYLDVSTEDPIADDANVGGTPTFVDGVGDVPDGAVRIEEDSGYAVIDDFSPAKYSNAFTISLWLNWRGTLDSWQALVSKRENFNYDDMAWELYATTSPDVTLRNSESGVWALGVLESDEQWQHIVATFDGETGKIYIDGTLAAEGDFTLAGAGDEVPVSIGALPDFSERTNGRIDDVRIYNYAMTNLEVAQMYSDLSGENVCVEEYMPGIDFNDDCIMNFEDIAEFATWWMYDGTFVPAE